MYKNVSLRSRFQNGRKTYLLIGPDGRPIEAFTAFCMSFRKSPLNTLESYSRHLALFTDYLIEATVLIGQGRQLTKLELTQVIEAYGEYLRLGTDSGSQIARDVATQILPSAYAASSVGPMMAAVRNFLQLSEEVRKEMLELAMLNAHFTPNVARETLIPNIGQPRLLRPAEVQNMQAHTMLAGVIAGGPKLIKAAFLDEDAIESKYDESRAFPYDKVLNLIDAMPNFRDKTYYSMQAACGGRGHEISQVLLYEDIDIEAQALRLVNPDTRPGHMSYRSLRPEERQRLAWKGRTSDYTLLIEPFASAFFENLQKYLELEHIAHGKHEFLFQCLKGPERGKPYFLTAPSTRLETFHRVCRRIGVKLPPRTGPHSLRHMYGTYALNYFPRANGDYGLPLSIVQTLMGHADSRSTLKYAKYDKDLLKFEIQNANKVLFRHGTPKNLLQLKLDALEAQIGKVRAQISQEMSNA